MNRLRTAYEIMDKKGWIRGELEDLDGAVCLLGSVWTQIDWGFISLIDDEVKILSEVCSEQYEGSQIEFVNDDLLKSKAEALALLDKAAVLYDERFNS